MRTRNEINVKIVIRPKNNIFDTPILINPFEGELGKKYEKEALNLVTKEIQRGVTNGKVELTRIPNAMDTIYTHSQDLEVDAYFSIE
tara:strand:+ start:21220 stop:21480 length:261 start_codon:yes stop_codon:yes gene_type:complete